MPERPNPPDLGEQALEPPVVLRRSEQLGFVRLIATEKGARIRSHVLNTVFGEPALNLGQGVSVLLRMFVLIAPPGLTPRRIVLPLIHDRVERNHPATGDPGHGTTQAERDARQRIVEAK